MNANYEKNFSSKESYNRFLNAIADLLTKYGRQSKSHLIEGLRKEKGWKNLGTYFLNNDFENILEDNFNIEKTYTGGCLSSIHISL